MLRRRLSASLAVALCATAITFLVRPLVARQGAVQQANQSWKFAVSGDSRNCGDVVMPAIASSVKKNDAVFYWHLGDLRYAEDFDADMVQREKLQNKTLSIIAYMEFAWPDFIENQIRPFGDRPYYVTLGNHDVIFPRTRKDFIQQFGDWLVTPTLQAQRLKDDPNNHMIQPYYHWVQGGVAFYSLDNASVDMIDRAQLSWFNTVLKKDVADPSITSIVVGMHAALPGSLAGGHSMEASVYSIDTGRQVYKALLDAQNVGGKHVYVLASHLHNYIAGAFNTDYWRNNGGVLPGWIVGTAGAYRTKLTPEMKANATDAREMEYGSLIGTVGVDGAISFEFARVEEADVPASVVTNYGEDFVHTCFAENGQK